MNQTPNEVIVIAVLLLVAIGSAMIYGLYKDLRAEWRRRMLDEAEIDMEGAKAEMERRAERGEYGVPKRRVK